MNALTRPAGSAPIALDPKLDSELRLLVNALEGDGPIRYLPAERAPSHAVRVALQHRQTQIDRWLQPPSSSQIDAEIGTLFLLLQSKRFSDEEKPKVLDLYLMDLHDLPAFALEAACRGIRRREHAGNGWVPDPGAVRKLTLEHAGPLLKERRQITAVLEAEGRPPRASPETHGKVTQIAQELCATLAMARPPNERALVDRAKPSVEPATLDELAERTRREPMPQLSEEARRKFLHPR